jgi:Tfp pilus assembly protein PilX
MLSSRTHVRRRNQRGFALILAMVAMVVLTVIGVTTISMTQMDLKITGNQRLQRQVAFGAMTGLDHARAILTNTNIDIPGTIEDAAAAGGCVTGWISSTGTAIASPVPVEANGYGLSTYAANFCIATCGQPLAGNSLGERVVGYAVDMVATGSTTAVSASDASTAVMGGLIYGQMEQAFCQ